VPWLLPLVNDVFMTIFALFPFKKKALENGFFFGAQHCHFCEMKNIGKKALPFPQFYMKVDHNLEGCLVKVRTWVMLMT
jgi:hypothetical protein